MKTLSVWAMRLQMAKDSILSNEEGQDLIEYALLVGFISLAAIAGITAISSELKNIYSAIASNLTNA